MGGLLPSRLRKQDAEAENEGAPSIATWLVTSTHQIPIPAVPLPLIHPQVPHSSLLCAHDQNLTLPSPRNGPLITESTPSAQFRRSQQMCESFVASATGGGGWERCVKQRLATAVSKKRRGRRSGCQAEKIGGTKDGGRTKSLPLLLTLSSFSSSFFKYFYPGWPFGLHSGKNKIALEN